MIQNQIRESFDALAPFDRDFYGALDVAARIGIGSVGGKGVILR